MKEQLEQQSDRIYGLAVIGGGPAGMAAAWAAARTGVKKIILLERNERMGGILPQCIHNGFGVGLYGADYTGPEYANIWKDYLKKEEVQVYCDTTVLHVHKNQEDLFMLCCLGTKIGFTEIRAKTIIFACGCRERTLGQMRIPGSRPAGIYMAGSAQFMVNICNLKPGSNIAILGFGDIGLIMARRLILEGMKVRIIFGERASGLVRNYVQCIREFGIESRMNYTLVSTHGCQRLKGITIAPKDTSGMVLYEQKEYIPCDTLLVAAGLIPETELWKELCTEENPGGGIPVDELGKTPVEGAFACGNVSEIADIVDKVTIAGMRAGCSVAYYLQAGKERIAQFFELQKENMKKTESYTPRKMENQIPGADQFVCIICPNGCVIRSDGNGFQGLRCDRGVSFAEEYARTGHAKYPLSTTVRMKNGDKKMLSVRVNRKLTKDEMLRVMPLLRRVVVCAPVEQNQVVWEQHWEQNQEKLRLIAMETIPEQKGEET